MYRTPDWIEERLERVLVRHEASVGYSTCFWHNVLHSTPLFDRSRVVPRSAGGGDAPVPTAVAARHHRQESPDPAADALLIPDADRASRAAGRQREHPAPGHGAAGQLFRRALRRQRASTPGRETPAGFRGDALRQNPFSNGDPDQRPVGNCRRIRPATPVVVTHVNALLNGLDELLANEGLIPVDVARHHRS